MSENPRHTFVIPKEGNARASIEVKCYDDGDILIIETNDMVYVSQAQMRAIITLLAATALAM